MFWILFGSEFGVRTELRALQLLLRLLVRSGTYCLRDGPGIFFNIVVRVTAKHSVTLMSPVLFPFSLETEFHQNNGEFRCIPLHIVNVTSDVPCPCCMLYVLKNRNLLEISYFTKTGPF